MRYLATLTLLSLVTCLSGPTNKRELYGIYRQELGEPGRTIVQSDSSEIHLGPIIYSWTELELKSWSRWEERHSFAGGEVRRLKGRWTFDGDSLRLYLKQDQAYESYTLNEQGALVPAGEDAARYRKIQ